MGFYIRNCRFESQGSVSMFNYCLTGIINGGINWSIAGLQKFSVGSFELPICFLRCFG